MSLLQDLTAMAMKAPQGAAVALLALDSEAKSFILITGPTIALLTLQDSKVRATIANAFVTLLEQMGQEGDTHGDQPTDSGRDHQEGAGPGRLPDAGGEEPLQRD